jgi:hypothetical protein
MAVAVLIGAILHVGAWVLAGALGDRQEELAFVCIYWASSWITTLIAYLSGRGFVLLLGWGLSPFLDIAVCYVVWLTRPVRRAILVVTLALLTLHVLNVFVAVFLWDAAFSAGR